MGKVIRCTPREIRAKLTTPIANGDGLGFFDRAGRFCGFRVNRADESTLYPATPQQITSGTELYRNHNKLREEALAAPTASRTIPVDITLRPTPSIGLPQESVDLRTGEEVEIEITGRHDPCVAHRAVPVVEAVTAVVLLDLLLEGNHGTF